MRTEDEIRADAAAEHTFSNGTEFDIWADTHCYECVHDNADTEQYCPILNVAILGTGDSPAWPAEWAARYIRFGDRIEGTDRVEVHDTDAADPDGIKIVGDCSEFEQRRDPGPDDPAPQPPPPPECDGQLDIIDAYLPAALDELTRAPATREAHA